METIEGITILKPNWFDIRKYGYTASKSDTHAASIQATIDAAAAAEGGTVFLPAGEYILDRPLRIESSGIAVVGANRATKITITDVNVIPVHVTGSNFVLAGVEFTHQQPNPGDIDPWSPLSYTETIFVDGATGTVLRDIVFVNATSAIKAKNPRGLRIEGIRGQPLQSGILIDSADSNVDVSISDVIFEPFWWSADRRVLAYQQVYAVAFNSTNNNPARVTFENVTANNYGAGFLFFGNGTPSTINRQSIRTAKTLFCRSGIIVIGDQLRLAVLDYNFQGLPGTQSISGVYARGSNIYIEGIGLRCDTTGQSAISVDATTTNGPPPNLMVLFRTVFIKDWNQQANTLLDAPEEPALSLALPPPFDAITKEMFTTAATEAVPAIFAGRGAYVEISGEKGFFQTYPANWPISGGPGRVNIVP